MAGRFTPGQLGAGQASTAPSARRCSAGHGDLRLSGLDRFQRGPHRRALALAQDLAGLVMHRHHAAAWRMSQQRPASTLAARDQSASSASSTMDDEADLGVLLGAFGQTCDDDGGPRSPPMASNRYHHAAPGFGEARCRRARGGDGHQDGRAGIRRVVVQVDLVRLRDHFAGRRSGRRTGRRDAGASARRSWSIRSGCPRPAHHAHGACCAWTGLRDSEGQPCHHLGCQGAAPERDHTDLNS